MASKQPKTGNPQTEIIDALTAAGYTLHSSTGGTPAAHTHALTIRLTPANLIKDGQHIAQTICRENNLQAQCSVFAQVPQPLLIVSIRMPATNPEK